MYLIRLIGDHLSSRGVSPESFQRHVGVSALELARGDSRMDVRRYRQAQKLIEDTGRLDDHRDRVPLAWTQWISQGWPELPALWFNSPSLGDAMQAYTRFRPLIGEADVVRCEVAGDQLVLSFTPDPRSGSCLMTTVSHFTMLQDLIDHYRERLDKPISARIEVGELGRPCSHRQLTDILHAPLTMHPGACTHRWVLKGSALWSPVDGHHGLSSAWARQTLEARLLSLAQMMPFNHLVHRIEGLIDSRWQAAGSEDGIGELGALQQHVAAVMGMSRWTLRRSLAEQGIEFAALVDGLRARRLPQLLSDPSLSLLSVGTRLGFSSPSAFSRYFRSSYGHPPSRDPAWLNRR